MANVTAITKNGRTGTGSFTVALPASGSVSYIAVVFHLGAVTPPANWNLIQNFVVTGDLGLAFYWGVSSSAPGTSWAFTEGFANATCNAVIVGYDATPTSRTVTSSTVGGGSLVSPAQTATAGMVMRVLADTGTSTVATYPTGHTLGQDQHRQSSAGSVCLTAVCHAQHAGGSTGTATWALDNTPESTTAFTLTLPFTAAPVAPTITTTSLNTMRIGTAFSQTLAATGDPTITWAVQSGSLPTGLSLNSGTGAITGTPTSNWTYSFTIRATNSSGFDDQAYSGTILFPSEVSRTTGTTTPGGTAYTRLVLSISGDPSICYLPTNKTLGGGSVAVVMAHGADDDETFAGNEPFETTEHCVDKGWVVISPYAHGNSVGNSTWQTDHRSAADWIDSLWPVSSLVLYGASAGGFGMILSIARDTWADYPVRGMVTVDTTYDLGWHWANGSEYELNLIRGGWDISPDSEYATATAGYDPALYPASAYAGIRALLNWSPNDDLAIGTVDTLAFEDLIDGVATVTLNETAGTHYAPENFATSVVNAWLDALPLNLTRIVDSQQTLWNVRARVSDSQQTRWNVRSRATDSQQTLWNVRARVGGSQATAWNIRSRVNDSQATAWNVRARVLDGQQSLWNVRQRLLDSQATAWDVRSRIVDNQQTLWDIRGRVIDSQQTLWNVRSRVVGSQVTEWNVRLRIVNSQETAWNVEALGRLVVSLSTAWNVRERITDAQRTEWDVRVRIADQQETAWAIRQRVTDSQETDWDVRQRIVDSQATAWVVESDLVVENPVERTTYVIREPRVFVVLDEVRASRYTG